MSTIARPAVPSATGPTHSRLRQAAAWAVTLALVIGAAVGYAVRWGTEPSKTVTKVVAKTVMAQPYSTSTVQTAQVYFDGEHASWFGPGQVPAGTRLTIHVNSTVKAVGVAVGTIPATVTWERLAEDAATGRFSQHPEYMTDIAWQPITSGTPDLTVVLTPGLHAVVVGTPPAPQGDDSAALAAFVQAS